ncbi:protein N-acetyltransferase, RimJ/RimL family [Nitrosomonas sp. PY1]|nr:protein N-acetyltransferase, RimJ/RimL family [Nitrosomonas sp. PY1]
MRIEHREYGQSSAWLLRSVDERLELEPINASNQFSIWDCLAAIEASLVCYPSQNKLTLAVAQSQFPELLASGVFTTENNQVVTYAEMFWQQPRLWHQCVSETPYPIRYGFSSGRRHPLRPPKPSGVVYRRYIPWLGCTLNFRRPEINIDLQRFNRWMNDPVVAAFWQETGGIQKHRSYLEAVDADPHMLSLIACLDDDPFGYFEVYWAKEDRIAPFYDAHDFDRGWHVLIGEQQMRGKPFVTAWLPSISHYLFLDECRTQRIVIEPRVDNHKMARNLAYAGYANLKEFDFPHKRAALHMLLRERFFSDQLWVPRNSVATHSLSLS